MHHTAPSLPTILSRLSGALAVSAGILFLVIPAPAAESAPATNPDPATDRALRANQVTEQRLAYTSSPDYNPYDTAARDLLQSANDHLGKKKYAKAIADAKKGLKHSRYSIDLLMVLSAAYRESGDTGKADEVRDQWISIVDAILNSGDGRSFATAFKVIDVQEEYAVLHVMRLTSLGQSLRTHDASSFDVMKVKSPKSDESFEIYFNIDLPLRWLNRQLGVAK